MDILHTINFKQYSIGKFSRDFIAGLTVAVVLIPQGMAYSMLAGLSPIYGLYAALVPLIIYSFFATSRYLSIGPVALMSIIILGGVSTLAEPGTEDYLKLVILSAFLAGLIQIAFAFFRVGKLSAFLSKPVMSGFISAAGIIIVISQLKYLLSLELPRRISILDMLKDVYGAIGNFNGVSLLLGIGTIAVIFISKKINKIIPGALIAVLIGILCVVFFELDQNGVPIIGSMPSGLPGFNMTFLSFPDAINLLAISLIIAIVGYVGSHSISMSLGSQSDKMSINPNKELLALGLSKVVGSFFMAMPSTGSFTRSAINYEAGGKTQISSIVTAVMLGLTLLFFSSFFYYLPEPVLAGIIISSVFSLINWSYAKDLYNYDRRDLLILLITFSSTLLFGITDGLIIGVLSSFADFMLRTRRPDYAILGKLPSLNIYKNIERYPEAEPHDNIIIMRFSQTIYFANSMMIFEALEKELKKNKTAKNLIISLPTHTVPDATASQQLYRLVEYCNTQGLRLLFTDLTGPMRDHMKKILFFDKLGKNNFYLNVEDAVDAILHGDDRQENSNKYSIQSKYIKKRLRQRLKFWQKKNQE